MTSQPDRTEGAAEGQSPRPRSGVFRVDLPFMSFRWAAGGVSYEGLSEDDAYEMARKRVRARLGFYRHLTTYFAVILAIVFIDLLTGGGFSDITLWIAAIWGAVLLWQGFNVFVFPAVWSDETEERLIQEELRRNRR